MEFEAATGAAATVEAATGAAATVEAATVEAEAEAVARAAPWGPEAAERDLGAGGSAAAAPEEGGLVVAA